MKLYGIVLSDAGKVDGTVHEAEAVRWKNWNLAKEEKGSIVFKFIMPYWPIY